jgi:hypothetical protein
MQMKKLYRVTIENEYYCVADDEQEAEELHRDAMDDFFEWGVSAHEVKDVKYVPKEWLDALTYGLENDVYLRDWIAEREKLEAEAKRAAELEAKQGKLPF